MTETESCGGVQCPAGMWCSRGKCACAASCEDAPREPVCADGRTFPNECALQRAACEARMRGETPPKVAYYGDCERHDANVTGNNSKFCFTIPFAYLLSYFLVLRSYAFSLVVKWVTINFNLTLLCM